jgi:predicted Zn-dependent protease
MRFIVLFISFFLFCCTAPEIQSQRTILDRGLYKTNQGPLIWEAKSFPISVFAHGSVSKENRESIKVAINKWNSRVGRKVFQLGNYEKPVDEEKDTHCGWVVITEGEIQPYAPESWYAFYVPHYHQNKICSGFIMIDDDADSEYSDKIFIHELGHALGLVHDFQRTSIMLHEIDLDICQGITEQDRNLVRIQMNN